VQRAVGIDLVDTHTHHAERQQEQRETGDNEDDGGAALALKEKNNACHEQRASRDSDAKGDAPI
jgi:hypothetical protein